MKRIIKNRMNGEPSLTHLLGNIFNDSEVRTCMLAIKAFNIPKDDALQLLAFGCPPHLLGSAWFLSTALGGDTKRVAMLCSKGMIYEALELLDHGKLGELTRLDQYPE